MPLPLQTILQDRYRIEAMLGQGGMGAVYRAFDLSLQVLCAVKENTARRRNQDLSAEITQQFEREAVILAGLLHQNLPRVTNYFKFGDDQYLVMDFVDGEDLAARLERCGRFSEAETLKWIGQVCDALTYLHNHPRAPIIHRDVKPANIKITPEGRAMLVDFGLSKMHESNVSTIAGAKGWSSGFSPPEQYDLATTDTRSDQYALAATTYALLSGKIPPDALERKLGYIQLTPLRKIVPGVSESVDDAVVRAMSLDPDERFESIEAFRLALRAEKQKEVEVVDHTATFEAASPDLLPATLILSNRTHRLFKERNLIGRRNRTTGEMPDIDLSDEPDGDTVSRKHAWLNFVDGEWYLQPHTDHKNVIRVNGKQVASKEESKPLRDGDQIQIGAVKLKFQL
ncbi:MAG: FHA domain-containing serine/threonine-protein kinase [Chloroflexota bacterium]